MNPTSTLPSSEQLITHFQTHPNTQELYPKYRDIMDAAAHFFANQNKTAAGIEVSSLVHLGTQKITQEAQNEIRGPLIIALKALLGGSKL